MQWMELQEICCNHVDDKSATLDTSAPFHADQITIKVVMETSKLGCFGFFIYTIWYGIVFWREEPKVMDQVFILQKRISRTI